MESLPQLIFCKRFPHNNYVHQGGYVFTLFVSQQDNAKTTRLIFTEFDAKVKHGPQNKPSDFDGNPEHVTLGLGLR